MKGTHDVNEPATPSKNLYRALPDAKPSAVVVYCSDPRFQQAFRDFVQHGLGLTDGMTIPIVVGGGAGVLGHPEQLPKEFKFLRERLEQYWQIFPTARRIILINHEDCRYYETLKSRVLSLLGLRAEVPRHFARADLALVSHAFRHFLSHLGYTIEYYYARFADAEHTKVEIEKIAA